MARRGQKPDIANRAIEYILSQVDGDVERAIAVFKRRIRAQAKNLTLGKSPLSIERLKEALSYDPETGIFKWNIKGSARYGKRAGTPSGAGYVSIGIDGRSYGAHRLAWYWMTGVFPAEIIDHKNRIKSDNRWANLRHTTQSNNMANAVSWRKKSALPKGVILVPGRGKPYLAKIKKNGKTISIGYFNSPEEASAAYQKKSHEIFGEYHPQTNMVA